MSTKTTSGRRKHDKLSVRVWFTPEQYEEVERFRETINTYSADLPLNMSRLCKQAIFYAMNDSKRRAQVIAEQQAAAAAGANDGQRSEAAETPAGSEQHGGQVHGDIASDTNAVPAGEAANPTVVAETKASGDQTPAGS